MQVSPAAVPLDGAIHTRQDLGAIWRVSEVAVHRLLLASVGPLALIVAACGGTPATEALPSPDSVVSAAPASPELLDEICDRSFHRYERAASGAYEVKDEQGFLNWEGVNPAVNPKALHTCLEPGQTVIAVEGLPGVSGLFDSREARMELRGFGPVASGEMVHGQQCFVAGKDQPFQTNAVIYKTWEGSDDPAQSSMEPIDLTFALTVDVGITSGDPQTSVAAVTAHQSISVGDPFPQLTHNYVPGPYRGPLIMSIDSNYQPTADNPWAGSVTVTSIFHNAAEYTPYVPGDNRWTGQGIVDGRITIWCGG